MKKEEVIFPVLLYHYIVESIHYSRISKMPSNMLALPSHANEGSEFTMAVLGCGMCRSLMPNYNTGTSCDALPFRGRYLAFLSFLSSK